jgi:hypothetical protein
VRYELVAHVAGADQSSDVPAAADRQAGKHELALGAADPRLGGRPVVRRVLRQAPNRGHGDPLPSTAPAGTNGSYPRPAEGEDACFP